MLRHIDTQTPHISSSSNNNDYYCCYSCVTYVGVGEFVPLPVGV